VTTLVCVRASKFVGQITGKNLNFIDVSVIGGRAGVIIMPVFSQDKTAATIDIEKIPDLDKRVQDAGTEIVNAKNGNSFRSVTYDSGFCHVAAPYSIVKLETHGCLVLPNLRQTIAFLFVYSYVEFLAVDVPISC
jgi:hypothetical protein